MTTPLPNMQAPIGKVEITLAGGKKHYGKAFLIPPWNSFFQQFVQGAPDIADIAVLGTPFGITANANGTMAITGGTITSITLTRGAVSIALNPATELVPIRINDMIVVDYSVLPTIQFLPD